MKRFFLDGNKTWKENNLGWIKAILPERFLNLGVQYWYKVRIGIGKGVDTGSLILDYAKSNEDMLSLWGKIALISLD